MPTNQNQLDKRITKILLLLGFVPHNIGYHYALTALKLTVAEPSLSGRGMTYLLYPGIAKLHQTTVSSVERGIRLAIRRAWDRGSRQSWEKVFQFPAEKAPTNSHFLSVLTQWIALELDQSM